MTDFVLVHGAWHGVWCWDRIRPLLETAGHTVYSPTLTGPGDRAQLLTRDVNLTTYIRDVVDLFATEDLQDAVLAGHSYAGMVISGAVRHVRDRLRHTVYLDSNLPEHGESGIESGIASPLKLAADQYGDGWRIPVPNLTNSALMDITEPDDVRWLQERLTDHPLATLRGTGDA